MNELTVRDIMTADVVTIGDQDNLEVADQVMRAGRIHHLPVLKSGKLAGVLTQADVLRARVSEFAEFSPAEELDMMRSIQVSMVMSEAVGTISPNAPAAEAARMLRRKKYGCLPVMDETQLVGIVTEGDFVNLALQVLSPKEEPARPVEAFV